MPIQMYSLTDFLPEMQDNLTFEAKCLSRKTGLRWQVCKAWMQANGIADLGDIIRRYSHLGSEQAYTKIGEEIEDMVLK
jgi:hypothetical protein